MKEIKTRYVILEAYGATPYVRQNEMAEKYSISIRTVKERIKEMKGSGRYKDNFLIEDTGITLVNEFAFLDWLQVRKMWKQSNTRKFVKPFDPIQWARYSGYNARLMEVS